VTGRPRAPRGEGEGDDEGAPARHDQDKSGTAASRPPPVENVAQAQDTIAGGAQAGRVRPAAGPVRGGGASAQASRSDDAELRRTMDRYERLGDQPPKFTIARNDDAYAGAGAHTIDRHGPDIPLPRDPNAKTIEGRIYGDTGWHRPESWSYRWTDPAIMNRTVRDYVRENWETIRSDLAMFEAHQGRFDAGHRIGQGYYNSGMYGAGPRAAQYAETSFVTIRVQLVPGSDPPEPFIVTAFPAGLL
jgi:hypothetical protein